MRAFFDRLKLLEAPVTWKPTYKFADDGTYARRKKQKIYTPSWADAIISVGMHVLSYNADFGNGYRSDHRPVCASLNIDPSFGHTPARTAAAVSPTTSSSPKKQCIASKTLSSHEGGDAAVVRAHFGFDDGSARRGSDGSEDGDEGECIRWEDRSYRFPVQTLRE